jgi:hypothetical protein
MIPARITVEDFRWKFADKLPDWLAESRTAELAGIIDDMYTLFYGCETLFNYLPDDIYIKKTRQLYLWLTGWFIVDNFPEAAGSVPTAGAGGLMLKQKKIGSVTITYDMLIKAGNSSLEFLRTNSLGNLAYNSILNAIPMSRYYNYNGV